MYFLNIDIKIILTAIAICLTACYTTLITTYTVAEEKCSQLITELTAELKDSKYYDRLNSKENTLSRLFVFYLLIPIILSSASIYTLVILSRTFVIFHPVSHAATALDLTVKETEGNFYMGLFPVSGSIIRYVPIAVSNILIIIFHSVLFSKKIYKHINKMSRTLTVINTGNIANAELFPIDLNTEISHTMYLLNKIILLFRAILTKTEASNERITSSTERLAEISLQNEQAVLHQSLCIEEILATLKNTDDITKNISTKLDEVINVAKKTLNNAQTSFHNFTDNLSKMQDITDSNQSTIEEIEHLSAKIEGIHDIINLIDSLAEQTKIVAFNAELVANKRNENISANILNVTDEIRQLAGTTMELTGQVKNKIQEIRIASENLIIRGESFMNKINEGNDLSEKLKNRFETIKVSANATVNDSLIIKKSVSNQLDSFEYIINTITELHSRIKSFEQTGKIINSCINELKSSSENIKKMTITSSKKIIELQGERK